jgi:vacuolar-type H+-ATPase catalytic subunit A/Vma1
LQAGRDLSSGINWLIDKTVDLFKGRKAMKVSYRTKEKTAKTPANKVTMPSKQERLDDILDKIAKSGYESLTKEEKEFLFHVSKEDS